jgi:BirA family biotin operon repressor/biotin-[acetyl-CoA-carboxylase] ligase
LNNTYTTSFVERKQLDTVDSTNNYLKQNRPATNRPFVLVTAEYQSAGRGQVGNSWESDAGRNLLFSIAFNPHQVQAAQQFVLSEAFSLSVAKALSAYTKGITIKWPNDIYYKEQKIAGILIENGLIGKHIDRCIIGAGININQQRFLSDAPNPVSLLQVIGRETDRREVLERILQHFIDYYYQCIEPGVYDKVHREYRQWLFRSDGVYPYSDDRGDFEATIEMVEPDGHLVLRDTNGAMRRYAFKEVRSLFD